MPKKVIILGGGVGGMSAAHELAERGFDVEVYEKQYIPGGKARSIPVFESLDDRGSQAIHSPAIEKWRRMSVSVLLRSKSPKTAKTPREATVDVSWNWWS